MILALDLAATPNFLDHMFRCEVQATNSGLVLPHSYDNLWCESSLPVRMAVADS
jgi:hypothetical protein